MLVAEGGCGGGGACGGGDVVRGGFVGDCLFSFLFKAAKKDIAEGGGELVSSVGGDIRAFFKLRTLLEEESLVSLCSLVRMGGGGKEEAGPRA